MISRKEENPPVSPAVQRWRDHVAAKATAKARARAFIAYMRREEARYLAGREPVAEKGKSS